MSISKEAKKRYYLLWYARNKLSVLGKMRQYYWDNKERFSAREKARRQANREYKARYDAERNSRLKPGISEKQRAYRLANPEKIREQRKRYGDRYRKNNPSAAISNVLSSRIRMALRRVGEKKAALTRELIGCSVESLREHLEKKFLPGMTWENRGRAGWHIDHKRPCASFDLTDPDQQRRCFHFSNLQPLWEKDNLRKSDTWVAAAP